MGDTKVENDAGWGLPINQRESEPIHWWTPSGRSACRLVEPHLGMNFAGDKNLDPTRLIHPVCLECVVVIRKAVAVLGSDDRIPDVLSVQIR